MDSREPNRVQRSLALERGGISIDVQRFFCNRFSLQTRPLSILIRMLIARSNKLLHAC